MQRLTVSLPALLTVFVDPNAEVKPEARPLKAPMAADSFLSKPPPNALLKKSPSLYAVCNSEK